MAAKKSVKKKAAPKKKIDYKGLKLQPLYRKAQKGDWKAYREMRRRMKEQARIANQNLKELEKAGYTEWAYQRAIAYTRTEFNGAKRFRLGDKFTPTVKDVYNQILEIQGFLAQPTSTVAGAKAAEDKRSQVIKELVPDLEKDKYDEFYQMIHSKIFDAFVEAVGSPEALDDVGGMLGAGLSQEQIEKIMNEIMEENIQEWQWDDYAKTLNWLK